MKKIIFSLAITTVAISGIAMMSSNKENTEYVKEPSRTCEYTFWVKCKGSNTYAETVRAKHLSEARTKLKNRYPNCTISNHTTAGKNCKD